MLGGSAVRGRRTPATNSYELWGMQRCSWQRVQHKCGYSEHSQKECCWEKFAHICYHQDNLHRGVWGADERQGNANQPAALEAPQHNNINKSVSSPHLYVSHLPTSYLLLLCSSHWVTVSN